MRSFCIQWPRWILGFLGSSQQHQCEPAIQRCLSCRTEASASTRSTQHCYYPRESWFLGSPDVLLLLLLLLCFFLQDPTNKGRFEFMRLIWQLPLLAPSATWALNTFYFSTEALALVQVLALSLKWWWPAAALWWANQQTTEESWWYSITKRGCCVFAQARWNGLPQNSSSWSTSNACKNPNNRPSSVPNLLFLLTLCHWCPCEIAVRTSWMRAHIIEQTLKQEGADASSPQQL